ncbi:MAG: hypothetical protein AB1941_16360 [Gemmatimonadota bacterium]
MAYPGYGERDSRGGGAARRAADRGAEERPRDGGAAGANLGDREDASLLGTQGVDVRLFLFGLLGGMFAWAAHFGASYVLVALGCTTGWGGTEPAVWGLTLLFGGVAAAAGWVAYRAWRRVNPEHDWDRALSEPRGWQGFLGMTGILLSATSVLAIVLEALSMPFLPLCQ